MNEIKINHGYYSALIRSYENDVHGGDMAGFISVCDNHEGREIMVKLTRADIDEIVRVLQDHVTDYFPIQYK